MAKNPNLTQVVEDDRLLSRLGYGVLDIESKSGAGFEDVRRYTYLVAPEKSPRAAAMRLRNLLGRPFTEKEARATWNEILQYKLRRMEETGEDIPVEQAAREWDERYGFAFRRQWYLTRPEPAGRRYMPGGRERGPGPVGKVTGLALPELRPLLEAGFSVTDILTQAAKKPLPSARLALRRVPRAERDRHYVQLVAKLTGWTLSQEEAERVWAQVLQHKLYLSEKLGQDVPAERAAVDYFKRLRLAGLDRAALWETGQLFAPNSRDYLQDSSDAPSTKAGVQFPA